MGEPRRILVLSSTFPRWPEDDLPTFVYGLCLELARQFEVHVLAPHAPGAKTRERLGPLQVFRYRYAPEALETLAYGSGVLGNLTGAPLRGALIPAFVGAQAFSALRLCRRFDYRALHAHWLLPQGLCGLLVSRSTRPAIPLLCTAHGSDLTGLRDPLSLAAKRWVLGGANRVTAVSQDLALGCQDLGVPAHKISVAPMGVDLTETFVPAPVGGREPNRLVFVGRLVPGKGCELLLEAFAELSLNHPRARLTLVGDGPLRAELHAQVVGAGLTDRVEFCGRLGPRQVAGRLAEASVAIVPSQAEGFGLVAVEAMGCGCALVVSDLPVLREVLGSEASGLFFRPGRVDDLAEKITLLLDSPDRARQMGEAGRARALTHFGWRASGERYLTLLDELIDSHGQAR